MKKNPPDLHQVHLALLSLLRPERSFFGVVVAYSVAIGLLTLAVPIAVQTLINTVANIASPRSVTILAIILFITLLLSGCFAALRMRVMEYYERHVYARLVSEMGLRMILAPHSYFSGGKNTAISHRYFDIMTLQKNIPSLMVDGVALVLQMLVGFTLVAFYHPFLLAFNISVLVAMYVIWRLWSTEAKSSAITLSEAKYSTAKWLANLAAAHEYVKSTLPFQFAGRTTENYIATYNQEHARHFEFTFKQIIMFLVLYAFASAALLGLGGWLVIQGQLSIGQLVAAELIMSAVFFGLSRFSYYMKLYYDLYGTANKIGGVLNMPQELLEPNSKPEPRDGQITFHHVTATHKEQQCLFDFTLEDQSKTFVVSDSSWAPRRIVDLLKRYEAPQQGWITLGGYDVQDLDAHDLRQSILALDRSLILEVSISDYLRMSAPEVGSNDINRVIDKVGLREVIEHLPDGLDTVLSSVGAPLSPLDFILLKLASAWLCTPKVLIMTQHLDALPKERRKEILALVAQIPSTVIYFTNYPIEDVFSQTIQLEPLCKPNFGNLDNVNNRSAEDESR